MRLPGLDRNENAPPAAKAVSRHVQGDLVEPGLQGESAYALARIGLQRPVGAHEGVLRDLFGVLAPSGEAQGEGVEAVLVRADQPLERAVEVLRERRVERVRRRPASLQGSLPCFCLCLGLAQSQPRTAIKPTPRGGAGASDAWRVHTALKHAAWEEGCR